MHDGNHSKRTEAPVWLVCVLIAVVTFGLSVGLTALLLPVPKSPTHRIHTQETP